MKKNDRVYIPIPLFGVRLIFDMSYAKGHRYVGWYHP